MPLTTSDIRADSLSSMDDHTLHTASAEEDLSSSHGSAGRRKPLLSVPETINSRPRGTTPPTTMMTTAASNGIYSDGKDRLRQERSRDFGLYTPPPEDGILGRTTLTERQRVMEGGKGAVATRTGILQVINESKEFSSEFPDFVEACDLNDAGFDYNVVAVFGSQSTGKSTLLNRLFGTRFAVMDESSRQQTTKGIWVSRDTASPTLVLDVEGTDGRERGEDQDFERKSALFSIAIAHCIIINMWENSVGLYHGANLHLLKTVLEVNLQLFHKPNSPKTRLLVVIRDYIGQTPFDALTRTVREDLTNLWDQLKKPEGLERIRWQDCFDVVFHALPHKILMAEQFEDACKVLRSRFRRSGGSESLFQEEFKRGIPADGFPRYAKDLWTQVLANRDLDLPSQQELLAQFRCDEIASQAQQGFRKGTMTFSSALEKGAVVAELPGSCKAVRDQVLADYDTKASRYHDGVYHRKREELVSSLNATLHSLFSDHLRILRDRILSDLKEHLKQLCFQSGDPVPFTQELDHIHALAIDEFRSHQQQCVLDGLDGDQTAAVDFSEQFAQVLEGVDQLLDTKRSEERRKFEQSFSATLEAELLRVCEPEVLEGNWGACVLRLQDVVTSRWDQYGSTLTDGFGLNAELSELYALGANTFVHNLLKSTVLNDEWVVKRMIKLFERRFKYTGESLPKIWTPDDDLNAEFKTSLLHGESLLARFEDMEFSDVPSCQDQAPATSTRHRELTQQSSTLRHRQHQITPSPGSEGAGHLTDHPLQTSVSVSPRELTRRITAELSNLPPAMTEDRRDTLVERYREQVEPMFVEAKRHIMMAQTASIAAERAANSATRTAGTFVFGSLRIPYWALAVVVILGWNEMLFVVQNPIWLLLVLLSTFVAYTLYFTRIGSVVRQPLQSAVGAGIASGYRSFANSAGGIARREEMEMKAIRSGQRPAR